MFPRKPLFCRREIAQAICAEKTGFASTRFSLQDGHSGSRSGCGLASQCDPFPSIWLSPAGVEPFFCASCASFAATGHRRGFARRGHSARAQGRNDSFAHQNGAVDSRIITTISRGTLSCGKSSLFFSSQRPLPAACRTPVRARLQALSPVLPLPMQLTRTWLRARPSAVLPVRQPAPFRARSAADETTLTAAAAGLSQIPATHGAFPVGGFFISRPTAALT